MAFGLREKITILVTGAIATSTLLVAKVTGDRAEQLLRASRMTELEDEAVLQAWRLIDQVDQLQVSLQDLAESPEFLRAYDTQNTKPPDLSLAERAMGERWAHVGQLDILTYRAAGLQVTPWYEAVNPAWIPVTPWFPQESLPIGSRTLISDIVPLPGVADEPSQCAIWLLTPIFSLEPSLDQRSFLRLRCQLDMPLSPHHRLLLQSDTGQLIFFQSESLAEELREETNVKSVSQSLNSPDLLDAQSAFTLVRTAPSQQIMEEFTRVDPLTTVPSIPLATPSYFQHGRASDEYRQWLQSLSAAQLRDLNISVHNAAEELGQVEGPTLTPPYFAFSSGLQDNLPLLRDAVEAVIRGAGYDGSSPFAYGKQVELSHLSLSSVGFTLDPTRPTESMYFLHYGHFDEEVESTIHSEVSSIHQVSYLVVALFGAATFGLATLFFQPLKQAVIKASRIIDMPRQQLPSQIRSILGTLSVARKDEVGDFARAGRRMLEELLEANEEMESRIEARTSELREANEQLETLSEQKDAFLAKVSHDLRQPLNAVFMQIESLRITDLDEEQRQELASIEKHALRELTLVNDLLEYQKLIMGAVEMDISTIDLTAMLEEICVEFRPRLADKPVTLDSTTTPAQLTMRSDAVALRRLLTNLVSNSCKFTQEGTICVTANEESDHVTLQVADTGRGMGEEEFANVFTPFVSNKRQNKDGTGLGLVIAKELAETMGGEISVESAPGQGTTFCIRLPLSPDQPE